MTELHVRVILEELRERIATRKRTIEREPLASLGVNRELQLALVFVGDAFNRLDAMAAALQEEDHAA